MSEEKVTTGSETLEKTMAPKAKIWPIVLSVIFVGVIVFFTAFLHWHEQPSFCSTMCHSNMQKYVDGYYSEDEALSVAQHAEADITCLGCHWSQAKMFDLIHEVVVFVSDSFTDPLEDMRYEFVNDEFCGACHNGTEAKTKEEATEGQIINPHNIPEGVEAHEGIDMTCGSCHSIHKTSTMVCAQCHDGMVEVPEGWETPEVTVNVMANHATSIDPSQCSTCHNDEFATSKETASEGYELPFHSYTQEVAEMHLNFGFQTFGCVSCHEENSVAACATCHAGVFDEVPEGWTNGSEPAEEEAAPASDAPMADGTYTSEAGKGIGGVVPVTVTVEGGAITAVEIGDNAETQGIGSKAIEQLPELIVAANGTAGVDAVSGASVTSGAIFKGVEDCIAQAQA